MRLHIFMAAAALAAAITVGAASTKGVVAERWVGTWTAMPQLTEYSNLPPPPYNATTKTDAVFVDTTIRQSFRVTQGGSKFRLTLSNVFSPKNIDLDVTSITVARPAGSRNTVGKSAIDKSTLQTMTFAGKPSVSIPGGAMHMTDPLAMDLRDGDALVVTIYLAKGQKGTLITSHPGSRTDSFLAHGNQANAAELTGATSVEHWYYINSVDVQPARPNAQALVVVGDSLTDGRGSTTNDNNRWTDQLFARMQASKGAAAHVSVLNQGAGGNRVLRDGLGPSAVSRIDRDVFSQAGVRWIILLEGVNDIGVADATDEAQSAITRDLIGAYGNIITRAHAKGLRIYGGTITPFGKNDYFDAKGLRERSRQAVNKWIRTSGRFDAVIDFDKAVRDPKDPVKTLAAYDVGDGLHFNPAGYKAFADTVPLEMFA